MRSWRGEGGKCDCAFFFFFFLRISFWFKYLKKKKKVKRGKGCVEGRYSWRVTWNEDGTVLENLDCRKGSTKGN